MTLIRNRADRIHARRVGALARLDLRDTSTPAKREAVDREALALMDRTAKQPQVVFTRKKIATASAARKAHRSGRL